MQFFLTPLLALSGAILAFKFGIVSTVLAIVFSVAAILTKGNGVLVFVSIFITKFLRRENTTVWGLCGILGLLFVNENNHAVAGIIWNDFLVYFTFFISLLGSAFSFDNQFASFVFGFLFFATYFISLRQRLYKIQPVLFCFFTFIILTTISIAISRYYLGLDFAFTQSRYKIYSLLSGILSFLCLYTIWNPSWKIFTLNLTAVFSILFFVVSSIWHFPDFQQNKEAVIDSAKARQIAGGGLVHPYKKHATQIITKSLELGVYHPSLLKVSEIDPSTMNASSKSSKFIIDWNYFLTTPEQLIVSGFVAQSKENLGQFLNTYIELQSDNNKYFFKMDPRVRADAARGLKLITGQYLGFSGILNIRSVKPDKYNISIHIQTSSGLKSRKTNKILENIPLERIKNL